MARLLILLALLTTYVISVDYRAACITDETCVETYNESYHCVSNGCEHKPISLKRLAELLGVIAVILVSALSNAGGMGGGEMIVPILMYVFNFTITNAIPLSKVSIFSGAMVSVAMLFNKRHSYDPNTLLIDYKIACFIIPLVLGGTIIGVTITKMLPPVIIFGILIIYLSKTTFDTARKARVMFKQENEDRKKNIRSEYENTDDKINQSTNSMTIPTSESLPVDTNVSKATEPRKSFFALISNLKLAVTLAITSYMIVVLSGLMRGGKGANSIIGISQCSIAAWSIFVVAQLLCLKASRMLYMREKAITSTIPDIGENTLLFMRKLSLKSYIAGVLAGTLGIGGGIVINPLLMSLNMPPQVAAATTSFIILFTSMSTTTQFIIVGAFELKIACYFIAASAIGSIFGNIIINKMLEVYKRQSLIVIILSILFFLSGVILSIIGVIEIRGEPHPLKFNSPC